MSEQRENAILTALREPDSAISKFWEALLTNERFQHSGENGPQLFDVINWRSTPLSDALGDAVSADGTINLDKLTASTQHLQRENAQHVKAMVDGWLRKDEKARALHENIKEELHTLLQLQHPELKPGSPAYNEKFQQSLEGQMEYAVSIQSSTVIMTHPPRSYTAAETLEAVLSGVKDSIENEKRYDPAKDAMRIISESLTQDHHATTVQNIGQLRDWAMKDGERSGDVTRAGGKDFVAEDSLTDARTSIIKTHSDLLNEQIFDKGGSIQIINGQLIAVNKHGAPMHVSDEVSAVLSSIETGKPVEATRSHLLDDLLRPAIPRLRDADQLLEPQRDDTRHYPELRPHYIEKGRDDKPWRYDAHHEASPVMPLHNKEQDSRATPAVMRYASDPLTIAPEQKDKYAAAAQQFLAELSSGKPLEGGSNSALPAMLRGGPDKFIG